MKIGLIRIICKLGRARWVAKVLSVTLALTVTPTFAGSMQMHSIEELDAHIASRNDTAKAKINTKANGG